MVWRIFIELEPAFKSFTEKVEEIQIFQYLRIVQTRTKIMPSLALKARNRKARKQNIV